ncbi:hypothetical protein ACFQES_50950 [Nonomuraea salmonea]
MGYLGTAALSVVGGGLLNLPSWYAAVGASLGVVVTAITGLNAAPKVLAWRLASWIGGGSWVTATMATGLLPPTPEPWLILAGITGALAGTHKWAHTNKPMPSIHGHHHNGVLGNAATATVSNVPRKHVPLAQEWVNRLYRICKLRVQITELTMWEYGGGFTAHLLLPVGGDGIEKLDRERLSLANDANLPHGCAVDFRPGDARREVIMDVSTVNTLKETVPYPLDFTPRDVNDGILLGRFRHVAPMIVQAREPRTVVVGTSGSGKTNTLHVAAAQLGLCFNNLTLTMDLNGGGIAQAWLRPWLDGRVEEPSIDWAAACREEALLMSHDLLAIGLERKTVYAQLQIDANSDKIPVSEKVPQVTAILDEGAELLSDSIRDPLTRVIRGNIEATARQCRAAAVTYLLSSLRSTQGSISTDLLALMHNRIWMAGGEEKEAQYLYDWPGKQIDIKELAGSGSGFVRRHNETRVHTWRAFRMTPADHIIPVSIAVSGMRPGWDAASLEVVGPWFATRHKRMRWIFSTPEQRDRLPRPEPVELPGIMGGKLGDEPVIWHPDQTHPAAKDKRAQIAVRPAPKAPVRGSEDAAASERKHLSLLQGGGWEDPAQIAARARAERQAAGASPMPQTAAASAGAVVHAVEQVAELPQPQTVMAAAGADLPEILQRVVRRLRTSAARHPQGLGRIHSEDLAAFVGVPDTRHLSHLLSQIGLNPVKNPIEVNGVRKRGYDLRDAEAVAAKIARGEQTVPEEVAAWPEEVADERAV